MARKKKIDPAVRDHLEWIGYVQPTGLVVSAPALVRAGAILDRRDAEGQKLLRECTEERVFGRDAEPSLYLPDFRTFAERVLGWSFSPKGYAGTDGNPIPPELEVPLLEYHETLRPDFAVRELDPPEEGLAWQLLVRVLEPGTDFDRVAGKKGGLEASAHGRMDRLLRRTGVSAGLLFNGRAVRLISAPYGESSGWADFRVADMVQTAGRDICTAMRLLLSQTRLLSLPKAKRLPALLEDSRKFQNEVSERLAEQVLHALYELLRGLQSAHDASKRHLLREPLDEHPDQVYHALLTVILRLVFLLYAEERGMLPEGETFQRHYSLAGLYDRLREDNALFPDTMDQRFGAWAQLLVLFRLIHDGADSGELHLPRRHGVLFDPDRFKFLEGRPATGARQTHERIEPPLVPDGTLYRALDQLLVLDGERISYRALDVEQIGSVYETMMGFRLETATGTSAALKAAKKHGAPATLDLEALLEEEPGKRAKWVKDRGDRKLTAKVGKGVRAAATLEDLHAALESVLDKAATPDLVPEGAMVLQPSEERRKSGSHYTPRMLTEPIVRTTLEPILEGLKGDDGRAPKPALILDLKVCDPAMGSGAFLVEACRQLGDALIEAWHAHDAVPEIPADEDEVIFARRLIAQRCLYGVDRNPVAVDLAKVSLWLATLAKEHPLTFVDHALRHGDSLVGLSRRQIEAFHWKGDAPLFQAGLETMKVRDHVTRVSDLRRQIREAGEEVSDWMLRDLWEEAEVELGKVRLFGDLVLAAFFEWKKPKEREAQREKYAEMVVSGEAESAGWLKEWLEEWRSSEKPLVGFHWEVEFPEVFERKNPGFDAFVGNPPFLGGTRISTRISKPYVDYLKEMNSECGNRGDLVAYFFRKAYSCLRRAGRLGFVATNTIAQGDTRTAGLTWIRRNGGVIYAARRRCEWPGEAAVVISIIYIVKGESTGPFDLDGAPAERITAYLFHQGGDEAPEPLRANAGICFSGVYPHGSGFQFDDNEAGATPTATMSRLLAQDSRNGERVYPYIGGHEILNDPRQAHRRFAISFNEMSLEEARKWPELLRILEERVRPERESKGGELAAWPWWRFWRARSEMLRALSTVTRYLAHPFTSSHLAFAFLPQRTLLAAPHLAFALETLSSYSILQSRPHETWARFFGSSMKDDLRYTPSDCFETFPFPENWEDRTDLEAVGKDYYEYRAALMIENDEGLTKTYNRFHDPEERHPEIAKLRELHAAMDRAVLDAYGWSDIPTDCEFLLDYEIDEEEWSPRKKKPWRYRWPDEVRDEVLARLLELNAERAAEERRLGIAPGMKKTKKKAAKRRKRTRKAAGQATLLEGEGG